jgi:hypothetical protein
VGRLTLAVTTLGHVGRINLTGGEPSVHPNFVEWAPEIKQLFAPNKVSIETNGFGFKLFPEAFLYFDMIAPTLYSDSFPGGHSDVEDIRFIENYRDAHKPCLPIQISKPIHVPRTRRPNARECCRATSGAISFFKNRLYPRCTGHGVNDASSIPLSEKWRDEIML